MQKNEFSIVLVVPPLIKAGVALTSLAGAEHIGLGYLTASLRQARYPVEILNFDVPIYVAVQKSESVCQDQIPTPLGCADKIVSREPDFVGFTVTGPTLEVALEIARYLRKKIPSVHISFGGHQATATAETLMAEEPIIDTLGLGDCDRTIVELVHRLSNNKKLDGLSGFLYRKNGKVVGGWSTNQQSVKVIDIDNTASRRCRVSPSEMTEIYELDDLPYPARDDLVFIHNQTGLREARFSTSRGCTEHCTFCADATQHNFRRYLMRSPENVITEITSLHEQLGINHFWFVDDNFVIRNSVSQQRVRAIAELIIDRKLFVTSRAYFRPDAFVGAEDLLPLLFRAGVVTGLIGVESGSPRRLKYFGKHCSLDDIRNTVKNMYTVKMGLQIGFIFFDPLTSFDDMRMDADFLYELEELYLLFNFVQNMDVYPGTSYGRLLKNRGLSTVTHLYRGGFRQYRYADSRIVPLASGLERLYTNDLMSIDHALWRVKIFNLPKLHWMALWDLVNASIKQKISDIQNKVYELCRVLNKQHYDFLCTAIDITEEGRTDDYLENSFKELLHQRQSIIEQLLEYGHKVAATVETAFSDMGNIKSHNVIKRNVKQRVKTTRGA